LKIKKNKKEIIKENKKVPKKWAREYNIDPLIFEYWKDEMMTEEEFKKLKNKILRGKE